jgi:hypothetical protein
LAKIFITLKNAVNFYPTGVVTHDRSIGCLKFDELRATAEGRKVKRN